jgi:hypothetical protein
MRSETEMRKIERTSLQKNLDALLAKPFLDGAEQQLVGTLRKKLADGATLDAVKEARRQPKIRV